MQLNKRNSESDYEIKVFTPREILSKNNKKKSVFDGLVNINKKRKNRGFSSYNSYEKGVAKLWHEFKPQILNGAITLCVAILVCVSINALDFSLGYEVLVDGENIGIVTDKDVVFDAIKDVKADVSKYLGENVTYEKEPAFVRRLVSDKKLADKSAIKKELLSNIETMVEGWAIYVDGQAVLGVAEREAAEWVLEKYMQKQVGTKITEDMSVDFCEKTDVKREFLSIAMLKTPDEAVNILSGNTKEIGTYVIKNNDTLWDIASKFGTSVERLLAINDNLSDNIKEGLEIRVEEAVPLLSVRTVQTVSSVEDVPYKIEKINDNTIYENTTVVAQKGVKGSAKIQAKVTKINGVEKSKEILASETITQPIAQIEKIGTKARPKTTGSGSFVKPSYGSLSSRYGSRWGRRHNGIDIAGSYNSNIKAADGGVVTYAGWMSGYGNYVVINHENGYQTAYGHCASLCVKKGARVAKGEVIAKMGNTGRSTGTHLHFEVKKNGVFVNPLSFVSY